MPGRGEKEGNLWDRKVPQNSYLQAFGVILVIIVIRVMCRSSKSATGRVGFEWPTISVIFCQRIPVTIVPRTESHD